MELHIQDNMETDQNIYYDIPYTQHTKLPHTEDKPYEKQNSNRDNEDIPQQSVPKPLSKILFLAYILEDETPNKAANQKPESKQLSKEQKKTGKMNYHSSPSRLSRSKSHKEAKPKPKNQTAKAHDPNKKPKMGDIQK